MKTVALLGFLLLVSCTGEDFTSREIQGQPPVTRISIVDGFTDGRSIAVYLESGTDFRSLVNLESFEGFGPAMSHDDARSSVGPPDQIHDSTYVYNRPHGRVEITRVVDRSGSDVFEQWQTRSYPTQKDVSAAFGSELSSQIEPHLRERSTVVLFHPAEYAPVLRVQTRGKLVESMVWYHE
jgi:hypothetical protein